MEAVTCIVLIIAVVGVGFMIVDGIKQITTYDDRMSVHCKQTFGNDWYFVGGGKVPDFCTTKDGAVRFPESWK